jgi:hypothetical protein
MLKRFGLFSLLLAGATLFLPASASAEDWHRDGRNERHYDGGRQYRRDYDGDRWRDRRNNEWREHEWREHERREYRRNYGYYQGGYYAAPGYYQPGYYAPQSGIYFSWQGGY